MQMIVVYLRPVTLARLIGRNTLNVRIIEENGFHASGRFQRVNKGLRRFSVIGRILIGHRQVLAVGAERSDIHPGAFGRMISRLGMTLVRRKRGIAQVAYAEGRPTLRIPTL